MSDAVREITVECTWRSTHFVEVPADFEFDGTLSCFPEDVLMEMDARGASLVDWEVL